MYECDVQAVQMQTQMQKLSPEQLQKMISVVGWLQRAMTFILAHKLLVVSMLLLVIALTWKVFM